MTRRTVFNTLCIIGIIVGIVTTLYAENQNPWRRKASLETPNRMADLQRARNQLANWPPRVGLPFPGLELRNHAGDLVSVDSLRGKPSLIEIVAMSCAGCQAYSGGDKFGGFGGFPSQTELDSIETYFKRFTGGLNLHNNEINFVQIVIYNLQLKPAEPPDVAAWRIHFNLDRHSNTKVLTGGAPLANQASFNMIPGFLLLDKDLVVRYDATGHNPRHNLYTELLPAIPKLLQHK